MNLPSLPLDPAALKNVSPSDMLRGGVTSLVIGSVLGLVVGGPVAMFIGGAMGNVVNTLWKKP